MNGKSRDQQTGFVTFWQLWPKHVAKADAIKAWSKIDQKEYPAIFKAVPVHAGQASWIKGSGMYIPYPATWLNGRRWEDELATTNDAEDQRAAEMVVNALLEKKNMNDLPEKIRRAAYRMCSMRQTTWPVLCITVCAQHEEKEKVRELFLQLYR